MQLIVAIVCRSSIRKKSVVLAQEAHGPCVYTQLLHTSHPEHDLCWTTSIIIPR